MVVLRLVPLALALLLVVPVAQAESFTMPPEVTPALRAACESDVRRLCIAEGATVVTVKSCMKRRFGELSVRCKVQIAAAGLTPAGR